MIAPHGLFFFVIFYFWGLFFLKLSLSPPPSCANIFVDLKLQSQSKSQLISSSVSH